MHKHAYRPVFIQIQKEGIWKTYCTANYCDGCEGYEEIDDSFEVTQGSIQRP